MNDVYGVDPQSATDFSTFASLMHRFETGHGRFIADFPRGWYQDFRMHVKSMSCIERMKAEELWLMVGKNAVVPSEARFNLMKSWTENAHALKGQVVKLVGPSGSEKPIEPIDDVLTDPDGFPDARGGHISRTPAAYAKAARPLLQTSPKVVLVDQYFKLRYWDKHREQFHRSWRHWKSLSALLNEAARWGRVEVFRLMVSSEEALFGDPDGEVFNSDLMDLAAECGVAGKIELELGFLNPDSAVDNHPRYLLGMNSGLHFDWGFDTGDADSTNHIEWMGRSVLKPLLERFTGPA